MKLFKKLAAAALAAVLALSMVGCGNANSVNSTKQFILNMMNDMAVMTDIEFHNTPELDGIAQKLLTEANAAYQDETQTDKTVNALMQVAADKADEKDVLNAETRYTIRFAKDYQFKCSLVPEVQKQEKLLDELFRSRNSIKVRGGANDEADELDFGVAVGKIGDETYVVVVETETPAASGTTTKG